ncbi:MAG: HdeD family acid-resistance protein [Acidobacteriaceae bacterium]
MSDGVNAPLSTFHVGLQELRRNWGWLLLWGIVLIVLGVIALGDAVYVTVISMFVFGWVLLIAGIVEAVQAIRHRKAGHLFVHTVNAVLAIVVGIMLLRNSLAGALVITLLLAAYFTVAGIFRIVAALAVRVPGWGWALASGIITLIFGILIWSHWPISGFWVIGMFIGIDLILTGWAQVALAMGARKIPV